MLEKTIFTLSPRLHCCARMVKNNSRIVDVGTDHAYLPIWLSKNKIISWAVASDANHMPLKRAKKNIKIHKVENVETRISNGLSDINESEADTIIIAGMGGELIYKIISDCRWAKSKTLILQPMSSEKDLRYLLIKNKYKINKEIAVKSGGKVYTIMEVVYSGLEEKHDELYVFVGGLLDNESSISKDTMEYIYKQLRDIVKRKNGEECRGNRAKADYYDKIIYKINDIILKYNYLE